jgi:hypothetical protein
MEILDSGATMQLRNAVEEAVRTISSTYSRRQVALFPQQ